MRDLIPAAVFILVSLGLREDPDPPSRSPSHQDGYSGLLNM